MRLSVVIPARNEEGSIEPTLDDICTRLKAAAIPHEVVVVNDDSQDGTAEAVRRAAFRHAGIVLAPNTGPRGFGEAVRLGVARATGDAIAIMMADGSDSPDDLVAYYRVLEEGYDCAFGSRFIAGAEVVDYPLHKLFLNRLANWFIKLAFHIPYNDTTNAFKCYRREAIEGMQPLFSRHFNLTVEMPLKAIVRGFSFKVIPIHWRNRTTGLSKLKIKEMGSRYLFITLYVLLEKHLARRDYHRDQKKPNMRAAL